MFNNVLNGKKGFLDCQMQNVVLTNGDNVQFSQGVSP